MLRKISSVTLVVALFCLASFATYHAIRYRSLAISFQTDTTLEFDFARNVILRDAGLSHEQSETSLVRARSIRDWIYRTSEVGGGTIPPTGPLIYSKLGSVGGEQLCGGLSVAYAWALQTVGIEARVIQLAAETYLSGRNQYDTHVTVEAKLGDRWIVSDPTFNAEFECSSSPGLRIGILEMRECLDAGDELIPLQIGTAIPSRTVESYYLPYSELLSAFRTSDGELDHPFNGWQSEAAQLY